MHKYVVFLYENKIVFVLSAPINILYCYILNRVRDMCEQMVLNAQV